jgi:NAD(P)-dependent dehydrogenase (short-subunit alcohol dehydrogenase family)
MEDTLFSVKDKVIIVTGGLGQLGAQYVKTLHDRGAKVAALATRVPRASTACWGRLRTPTACCARK